jgi:hypothetical protein
LTTIRLRVDARVAIEQECCRVDVVDRAHQGRRTRLVLHVDVRPFVDKRPDGRRVAAKCGIHQPRRSRVERTRRRLSRRFVRPRRTLIDPVLDDLDLLRAQSAGRRHLTAVQVAD